MAKKDKPKTPQQYEAELKEMIQAKTGAPMEAWLYAQLRATAMNMAILDKLQEQLLKEDSFISIIDGSMGQKKNEVNPLLSHYDKAQRTFMDQLEALGLNYCSSQNKPGKGNNQEADPFIDTLKEIKGI